MLKIGVFPETDIGEILFLCGYQTMDNKLFVLDPSKNWKNWLDKKSLIFIESTLIIWPFNRNKEKVNLEELMKSLIVGLKVVLCHMLKFTTRSAQVNKNSKRSSRPILSVKVSIKLEDGSTH